METVLSYVNTTLASCAVTFALTMIFRQKIVDWFTGVPSHLRTGLKQIEAGVLAKVKTYEADLVSQIVPQAPKPVASTDLKQTEAGTPADKPVLPEVPAA